MLLNERYKHLKTRKNASLRKFTCIRKTPSELNKRVRLARTQYSFVMPYSYMKKIASICFFLRFCTENYLLRTFILMVFNVYYITDRQEVYNVQIIFIVMSINNLQRLSTIYIILYRIYTCRIKLTISFTLLIIIYTTHVWLAAVVFSFQYVNLFQKNCIGKHTNEKQILNIRWTSKILLLFRIV